MNVFDDVLSVVDGLSGCATFVFLLLTFPIWGIPYLIYKIVKEKRGGRQ